MTATIPNRTDGATDTLRGGIPKVFHRVWLGGPLPVGYQDFGASFSHHHPGWELRTWTDTNLPPLQNQETFDRATSFAMRADIVRYELLWRMGGVYVDTDFEALRNLEPLIDDIECFLALEDTRWIAIGLIGSRPGHPFMRRLVDELPGSVASHPGRAANVVTGPQFVTRTYDTVSAAVRRSVALLPAALVYPYHFSEPERARDEFPHAYAVHHWAKGW